MKQPYKPRLDRKFIGGYRPRIDGWEKASGKAEYADDIATSRSRFPGTALCHGSCVAPMPMPASRA